MNQSRLAPVTVITSPDATFRLWLQRRADKDVMAITCGFSLTGRMSFVDALDKLDYVSVESARTIDEDLSFIKLHITVDSAAFRLIEDIPEIMEHHLK